MISKIFIGSMIFNLTNAPVICIHDPLGPGNSGALNFSFFKAPLKTRQCGTTADSCSNDKIRERGLIFGM